MSLLDDASLIVTPNGYKGGVTTGKLYSVKPTSGAGDMVVTRNTTATRVNSAGLLEIMAINVPRLDYPPLGGCPSILVEPQRKNEVIYSEQFNNLLGWSTINATVNANVAVAPDNNTTADKFIPTFVNSVHFLLQSSLLPNAYTFSVFAKAGEETTFSMFLLVGTKKAVFNLTGVGSVIFNSVDVVAKIDPYPNGWYRCSIYNASLATDVRIYGRDGTSFEGNNVNGFFLWGAQAEAGSYATSYIPTVAGTITRNADVISKTGISSLIGQTEGTLYAEVIIKNTENQICASIQRDSGFNHIFISQFLNKRQFSLRANNVTIFNYNVGVFLSGTNKVALVYNTNGNISAFLNGVKVSTLFTSAFAFSNTLDSLQIFDDGYYSSQNTTNNKSTILFKTALTDGQAISLTTL